MASACPHRRKALFRVIIRDGRARLTERCLDCGVSPRGPGVWVSRRELRVPLEDVPLLNDCRPCQAMGGLR